MKIGFGCDHAAVDLKDKMIAYMKEKGYECVDYGTNYDENGEIIKCDYLVREGLTVYRVCCRESLLVTFGETSARIKGCDQFNVDDGTDLDRYVLLASFHVLREIIKFVTKFIQGLS